MKTNLRGTVLLALLALNALPARILAQPPQYVVTVLNNSGNGQTVPFGINDSGQVAGTYGYSVAVVWNNGPMQTFLAPGGGGSGGFYTYAYGINTSGLVVGFSPQPDALAYYGEVNRAIVWNVNTPGTATVLGDFGGTGGGTGSAANAINASGLVVGYAIGNAPNAQYAVLWNVNSPGTPTILGSLGGTSSSANAINDSGLIAGYSYTNNIYGANVTQEAVLWNVNAPGSPIVLGSLGGTAGSVANAINASGLMAGSSNTSGPQTRSHAVVWNGATPSDLGTLNGDLSGALAINDAGDVVGYANPAPGSSQETAFLYTGGTMYDLNTLLVPGSNITVSFATAINNRGQIAAYGNGPYGGVPLLLTPITTLQSWRQQFFGTTNNTGNAADTAAPYGTCVPNLLVYSLLGPFQNPAQARIGKLPQVQMTGGNLSYSFTEPPGVSGVTYGAEWNATLLPGSWTAITDTGTAPQHLFSVPMGSYTKLFLRLRVTEQ